LSKNRMEVQYLCPLIQVFDMNVSLKFYCEVLGFVIHQSAGEEDKLDCVWLKWNNADQIPRKKITQNLYLFLRCDDHANMVFAHKLIESLRSFVS
jgi:hypothetical protein